VSISKIYARSGSTDRKNTVEAQGREPVGRRSIPNCLPKCRDNYFDHNHAQQGGALNDGRYCSGLAFSFFVLEIGYAHVCERPGGEWVMIFDYSLAALVAAGLLCYLLYALLRPERF
jgi:K+-transporting ATPase KdpF subunit